jgi:uncharacterized DUF497 family protein
VQFEWDPNKNQKLIRDRRPSFEEAKAVWNDPDRVQIEARSKDEVRLAIIGMLNGKLHTVFFTLRGSAIRLITVRRAHPDEEEIYEKGKNDNG